MIELGDSTSSSQAETISAGVDSFAVTVPDAELLFRGEYHRVGTSGLKIVGEDGKSFYHADYFVTRPNLMSPEGATLSSHVVQALAGPLAPGQVAQAGGPGIGSAPVIGRVDAVSGSATVIRNGVTVSLNVGDNVRQGDVVQTSGSSSVAIVFADGSTFSLSANARMVLDSFVFNAGGTSNAAAISLVQGAFSFVAGQVAKTGEMRVETPVATLGIRGTAVLVEISANDGQTRLSVMVEPDGSTGSFNIYNKTTGALIGTVNNSQVVWTLSPAGPLQVVAQQEQKTPAQLQDELSIVQQIFTIFNNNQQNPFVPQDSPERRGDNPNDSNPQTAGSSGTGEPLNAGQQPTLVAAISTASGNQGQAPVVLQSPPPDTLQQPLADGSPPPPLLTVVVTPNQPPIPTDDPGGGPGGGNVIPNDRDPEGGIIRVVSVQLLVDGQPQGQPVAVGASGASVSSAFGTLTIKQDGTYAFEPSAAYTALAEGQIAADQFQYTISDPFGATASAILTLNLTGVNDAPTTSPVTLQAIAEDSGERLITSTELLAKASDVDGDGLTVSNLQITGGKGSLVGLGNGTWTYIPAANDDSAVSFSYTVTDGALTAVGTATLDIIPVNDAPTTSPVALEAIAEDSGERLITSAELLASASDTDGSGLAVSNLLISAGSGTLVDNNDGTWTYIPAANDDSAVSFSYTVTDGALTTAGTATLDITPVNDVPTTSPVALEAIAEDSAERLITSSELLSNASDIDGSGLAVSNLLISAGSGTLVENNDGTWTYIPAANDDSAVSFSYTVTDGALTTAGTATLDITPVNDLPTTSPVALEAIEEDSGERLITSSELLANASDIDSDGLTVSNLQITGGNGCLVVNDNGTWTYIPAANDDSAVSFSYIVTDGALTADGAATLDIIPVNDAPAANNDLFQNIPLGWAVGPNNHLYKYVSASQITWEGARSAALEEGGYLATITSEEENNFIFDLVGSKVAWLGGSDSVDEGTWTWVTGEAFEFTGWAEAEPNDRGDGEYFSEGEDYLVSWHDRTWNDLDNSWSDRSLVHGYVIERSGTPGANYLQVTEDDEVNIPTALVLANDTDIDDDELNLTLASGAGANFGESHLGATIELNGSAFVYSAAGSAALQALNAGQIAEDYFYYQINDGDGGASTARVTLTVNGLNDAPLVEGASQNEMTMSADSAFNFDPAAFSDDANDVEGALILMNSLAGPDLGVEPILNPDASVTYDLTPSDGLQALIEEESSDDRFNCALRDEHGAIANIATTQLAGYGANEYSI